MHGISTGLKLMLNLTKFLLPNSSSMQKNKKINLTKVSFYLSYTCLKSCNRLHRPSIFGDRNQIPDFESARPLIVQK